MHILYLGNVSPSSTTRHRADALRRLGHQVTHLDAMSDVMSGMRSPWGAIHYRTGYVLLRRALNRWFDRCLQPLPQFDLCWIDSGELFSRSFVERLHAKARKVVLFNHDDPTGGRDGLRFHTLRGALPGYDLCVVVRPFNVDEFRALGARQVLRVYMSYDEVKHSAPVVKDSIPERFDNDVVFIGRNMDGEGRDLFMLHLIEQGIKPAIWGDNWQSSKVWPQLQPYWRGGSISGEDYVFAMRHAKICIGMLSKGNRDQHTTRSMEIPYAGGLLCAQRTPEHQALYTEGVEAVFWKDAQECAARCKALLAQPDRIEAIKAAGHLRVLRNEVGSEDLCRKALSTLGFEQAQAVA